MSEILDESINVLSDTANKKEIEIVNQVSKKLEVIIDYAMINVIFRNLISNSIKFTNRGGKVIIGAEDKAKEILVYVKDNGIGMSLEILEKIFRIDQKVKSNFFKETVDKILKVPAVRETYQNELSYENGRDAYGNSTSIVRTVIPKEKTITKE